MYSVDTVEKEQFIPGVTEYDRTRIVHNLNLKNGILDVIFSDHV